jgi:hypothetical protein
MYMLQLQFPGCMRVVIQDTLVTSLPIADLTRSAPAPPLVFPQISDGGGYRTEFILLSSGNAVTSVISFFGDDGTPLPVGL